MVASENMTNEMPANVQDALALEALLVAREHLYTLFHKCFGGVPSAELLSALLDESTVSVAEEYADDNASMAGLVVFLRTLASHDADELLDQAKDEYTRIFVGPVNLPASPYESPYTGAHDMSLFQENTLAVRRAYHAGGLRLRKEQRIPDDHVSAMCHFMALCGRRALAAFQAGDATALAESLRAQSAFVDTHMVNWLGTYAQAVRNSKAGVNAVFYPQLLEAVAAFAESDAVFLKEAAFWAEQMEGCLAAIPPHFEAARDALRALDAIRLLGLEECELEPIE